MFDSLNYCAAANRYEQGDTFYRRCGRSGILLPAVSLLWQNGQTSSPPCV